ncbi:hypothetical protein MSG28_009688 [Choristoneura fumiferana]|uniref:Uncharacterized protein n=1 Tax=Choristoneura fumiferana TaxID=7141 RepID=A0ACC0JCG4_CHOFU|nr:hypothetical protein MSG28_009688 [Choristoneura fumiferana]
MNGFVAVHCVLENSAITNAGYGSNLSWDGSVECDASVMNGQTLHFGACGAVSNVWNPISLAKGICDKQCERLSLGRVPPCILTGQGAKLWAARMGIEIVGDRKMISARAYRHFRHCRRKLKRYTEQNDIKFSPLDTVGAICIDSNGLVAAGASSGGVSLKHEGRVGQAANYASGVWAMSSRDGIQQSIASCTSGCGEHLIRTQLAKNTAESLLEPSPILGLDKCLKENFLESPHLWDVGERLGGTLALRFDPRIGEGELFWGHTTKTMCVGFMSTESDRPKNSVLKSKLQSKIDALSIMGKELDKCSMERDKYKLLVEQMKSVRSTPSQENNSVETLKSKLEEATGDIVALRKQLQKKDPEDIYCCRKSSTSLSCSPNDYEQLVQDLEKIHKKYEQLQLDYRATLDEKEELVSDRDYYKNKVQRLNHQISYILANRVKSQQADRDPNAPNPVVDLDAVVMENKYLHERINQLQVEKEIIKRTLTKYKTLLENRTNSNMFHLSKGFADVMTPKQVREYLDVNSKGGSKRTSAGELKSICLGLFEALNDKSTALQHQRKTNQ